MASDNQETPRQLARRQPMARYVVWVDRQAKSSFAGREEAETEAKKIRDAFPKLLIQVTDTEAADIAAESQVVAEP